jgi:nanoRNase/pAp phosphatase (c-di-AMP/oligoRNAs hydrolase)
MSPVARASARDLLAVLKPAREIVILPHDNPDPDSLASAEGLRTAIRHLLRKPAAIGLSGIIGRSQNRAMVSTLRLELQPIADLERQLRETVVLVDTQPGRKNNSLPPDVKPAAVIDHHPDWGDNEGVPFLDLREGYGATSTIVTEYLQELEVPIRKRLATALFYGITSETRNLGREAQPADIMASQFLYPYVDKRVLAEIEAPRLKASYFRSLGQAIESAVVCDDVVISILPEVSYPDAVAELVDLLIRLEGALWALCIAPCGPYLQVSVRSNDRDARAGEMLACLLPPGTAGGHGMVAAGRVILDGGDWRTASCEIAKAVLAKLGRTGKKSRWLISRPDGGTANRSAASRLLDDLPLEPLPVQPIA